MYWTLLGLARIRGWERGEVGSSRYQFWRVTRPDWIHEDGVRRFRNVVFCRICCLVIAHYARGNSELEYTRRQCNAHGRGHLIEELNRLPQFSEGVQEDAWCWLVNYAMREGGQKSKAFETYDRCTPQNARVVVDALLERSDVQAWIAKRTAMRRRSSRCTTEASP